jgi:hypothetical protein
MGLHDAFERAQPAQTPASKHGAVLSEGARRRGEHAIALLGASASQMAVKFGRTVKMALAPAMKAIACSVSE